MEAKLFRNLTALLLLVAGVNYARANLSVTVYINPGLAVAQGAVWNVDNGAWQTNGANISVSSSQHTIYFTNLPGWTPPNSIGPFNYSTNVNAFYTEQTGNLRMDIGPASAVAAGAAWEVDSNGLWLASGATNYDLQANVQHTVTFTNLPGWITPTNQPVRILYNPGNPNAVTLATNFGNNYVLIPQVGSLAVFIQPAGAVAAGAEWNVDNGPSGPWQMSGTTNGGLSTGLHEVYFNTVSGWNSPIPNPETVFINLNAVTAVTNDYVQQTGSLQVNIFPTGLISAEASWNVDGGSWQASGATLGALTVGPHLVNYTNISGWTSPGTPPGSQSVTVTNEQLTIINGTYLQQTGSLQVFILPAQAVAAGAEWNVDGGTFLMNGNTVSGLPVGSHTVSFLGGNVGGWQAPVPASVTVNYNSTTIYTGNYTAPALTIGNTGNGVVIFWPLTAAGWTLQTNTSLNNANWGNYLGTIVNNSVTNPPSAASLFYRLMQ